MRPPLPFDDGDVARPYLAPVFEADVLPGVDIERLNELADELDDDASSAKLGG